MALVYKLIISLIAFFYLYVSFGKIIKRQVGQSLLKTIAVITVWVGVLVFTWYPQLAEVINKTLGFGENMNTLIFIGFIAVFAIIFRILGIIERIEGQMISLVRSQAISSMYKTPEKVNTDGFSNIIAENKIADKKDAGKSEK